MKNVYKYKINYTLKGGMDQLANFIDEINANRSRNFTITRRELQLGVDMTDLIGQLTNVITNNKFITHLTLDNGASYTLADHGSVIYIANIIEFNRTITRLTVKHFDFSESDGILALANALLKNNTITNLELSYNSIQEYEVKKIFNILKINKTIRQLDLQGNAIHSHDIEDLADALKSNNTLTHLNLSSNKIHGWGLRWSAAYYLSDALKSNNTLTTLNLADNDIEADGAKEFADALKENNTLRELNLERNNILDKGVIELADALKENNTLTELNLENNKIKDDGVIALADALESNSALTALNLEYNQFGDTGFSRLAEALSKNNTITNLSVKDNRITTLPLDLTLNRSIIQFDRRGNAIENIHPLVFRWLNQLQEQRRIDQDSQNIHNHRIQLNTKRSYINIIKAVEEEENGVKPNVDEVISKISNHPSKELDCVGIGTISLRNFLIEKARNCTQEHGQIGLSFGKALWYVWKRIESLVMKGLTSEENIIKILCDEFINGVLGDNTDKCFTGGITRIINALNSIDPLVNINLQSDNERINLIVKKVYDNINDIYDEYIENITSSQVLSKVEVFKDTVEKELEKEGISITDEIISKFIIPLSDMIDENELDNMLNDRRKSEKESVIVTDNMSRDFIKPTLVMTNDDDLVRTEK